MMPPKASAEISFGKARAADGIERDARALAVGDPHHLSDQVDFFRGDDMHCAGVEELLLLRRGARQRDGRRAGVVGDLDRGQANAAGRRRNEDEIALGDLRVLDEGAVGSHEHHPDRSGLGERKRLRLPDDGMVRNEDDLAIGRVVVQREGRDDVDFVTDREAAHVLADSIDDARGLVAETCRKLLDGLDVVVDPPHGFGAVDADRLDLDADLVRTWSRNLDLDELENLRSSGLCEFDRA